MAERHPLTGATSQVRRAYEAIGAARDYVADVSFDDMSPRTCAKVQAIENKCNELRGELHSLLERLDEMKREVRRG